MLVDTFFSGSASRHMASARDQPTANTALPPLELPPMWQMAVSSAVSGLRHCLRHSPLEKFQNLSVPSCAPEINLGRVRVRVRVRDRVRVRRPRVTGGVARRRRAS